MIDVLLTVDMNDITSSLHITAVGSESGEDDGYSFHSCTFDKKAISAHRSDLGVDMSDVDFAHAFVKGEAKLLLKSIA